MKHGIATAVSLLALVTSAAAAELDRRGEDWHARGTTYRAVVDGRGNFRSLVIHGVEFLGTKEVKGRRKTGGAFPGDERAESVQRAGDTLVATRGPVEVRYQFRDDGFALVSEGGAVRWVLSDRVTACVSTDGVVAPGGARGDVYQVVAGRAAIRLDQPHHIYYGRLFPSRLTRGGKPEERFQCRWTCGIEVRPAELVDIASLQAAGRDPKRTAMYPPGQTPRLELALNSLAGRDALVEVPWTVRDHPHDGDRVLEKAVALTIPAGTSKTLALDVPLQEPGLYWARARLRAPRGGKTLQKATLGIIYDADRYKPPLTRPADFEAFWDQKLAEMRRRPFDARLAANDAYATENYVGYDLDIVGHDGERLKAVLVVPRKPGPHDAEVGGYRGNSQKIKDRLAKFARQPVGVGMWQRGAKRIRLSAPLPRNSTYTHWNGRDDNNMLHSYLRMVRLADYLRSRDDVGHIWLFGASRTGASMLAAAALAPEQVAAVNVHVPTCCGISWAARPYRGWGRPPSRDEEGLRIAAYFDPVNFAPDLEVPLVMDGGFYDGLAPAPGILAFHNHAARAPFRRCFIEQGQHGYFAASHRKQMEEALARHLAAKGIVPRAEQTEDGDR
ncbi:MAG: acetylxylan esterase [bacterium]